MKRGKNMLSMPSLSNHIILVLIAILVCIGLAAFKKLKWLIIAIIITVLLLIKTGMIAYVKDYKPPVIEGNLENNAEEIKKPEMEVEIEAPRIKYIIDNDKKGFGLDVLDHIDENTSLLNITDNLTDKMRNSADAIDSGARKTEENVKEAVSDAIKKARDESNAVLQQSDRSAEGNSQE